MGGDYYREGGVGKDQKEKKPVFTRRTETVLRPGRRKKMTF